MTPGICNDLQGIDCGGTFILGAKPWSRLTCTGRHHQHVSGGVETGGFGLLADEISVMASEVGFPRMTRPPELGDLA